jgi:hypothetical protein
MDCEPHIFPRGCTDFIVSPFECLHALGYNKLLDWITPRAPAITNLIFLYKLYEDIPFESSDVAEKHFRSILKTVAPTLQSLRITSESDGPGFDLKWDVLKDIAAAAKNLTSLELLFINDGDFTAEHVDDIKVFTKLEKLALRWMPFSEDSLIRRMPDLTTNPDGTLSASASASILRRPPPLPSNLYDLTHLKSLHLNSELLKGPISGDLAKLKNLSELRLVHQNVTKLEYFPDNLSKLSLRGSTNGNAIMQSGLGHWLSTEGCESELKELDLSYCNLTKFNLMYGGGDDDPDEPEVANIEILDLSNNNFGATPALDLIPEFYYLRRLDLSHCGISVLPDMVAGVLVNLEQIDLSFNNLVDLPSEFRCLRKLEYVNLMGNNFPAIPESLKTLKVLEDVNLSQCVYLEISKSVSAWLLGLEKLLFIDLHKRRKGRFQESSVFWLKEAVKELTAVGRGHVLRYDSSYLSE